MKKDIETVIGIGLIALLMSILFYPLLHETGHIISSLIVGGKIVKFNMIPPASVICDMKNVSDIGIIIVGISGNLFPTIVCILMYTVNKYTFWFWYTRLNLCAI